MVRAAPRARPRPVPRGRRPPRRPPGADPVTDHERTALTLAAIHYRHPAVRETHAMEQLGLTPTRYWALVDHLLDRPDALAKMPAEVHRLRRVRDARKRQRAAR
nr:DUF3263 domain-containing protein [Nocardioides sp. MAH-18]